MSRKRKRPKEEPEEDPITLDPIKKRERVVLDGYPYSIISLYDWCFNRRNNTCPHANELITSEQRDMIEDTAKRLFPRSVDLKFLSAPLVTIKTTSLISARAFLSIVIHTLSNGEHSPGHDLESIVRAFAKMPYMFTELISSDKTRFLVETLFASPDEKLKDLVLRAGSITIYCTELNTPAKCVELMFAISVAIAKSGVDKDIVDRCAKFIECDIASRLM